MRPSCGLLAMVRKDEPLKVTDLEGGDEVSPSNYGKGNKEPVKRSVFNRLAYGAGSRASKRIEEQTGGTMNKPESGNKTKLTGGKASAKGKNVNNKSGNAAEVQQTASPSVFDRLTSGDRSYRTTTQTGRKPAGRRAEPSLNANRRLPLSLIQTDVPVIAELLDETGNGSQEMDELDVMTNEEEEDPVIHVALIQPPDKIRSPRPVLKKSARLLRSQQEQLQRRKSWVYIYNFASHYRKENKFEN